MLRSEATIIMPRRSAARFCRSLLVGSLGVPFSFLLLTLFATNIRYGNIVSHCWFGDGFLLVGFSRGQVVALSTHTNEVSDEMWSKSVHSHSIFGVAYSSVLKRGATAGDGGVKIIDMNNDFKELKEEAISMDTSDDGE